jgi:hypothetical protein
MISNLLSKSRNVVTLILLFLLIALSFYSSSNLAIQNHRFLSAGDENGMITWKERMELVVESLPENGEIGYLSERDFVGLGGDPIDQDEEFAMTQYWLAPRILVEDVQQDIVLINLANIELTRLQQLLAEKNLHLVDEFGYGLYLAKKGLQ